MPEPKVDPLGWLSGVGNAVRSAVGLFGAQSGTGPGRDAFARAGALPQNKTPNARELWASLTARRTSTPRPPAGWSETPRLPRAPRLPPRYSSTRRPRRRSWMD